MKKYSSIITGILLVAVLSFTTSSCSRKVGCYYSLTPEMQTSVDLSCIPDVSSATEEAHIR